MDAATPRHSPDRLTIFLAGLQSGMLGGLWMLAWLGLSDVWRQRSFWSSENLTASVFYGSDAIRAGFTVRTLTGAALHLVLYSLLGGLFALAAGGRARPVRLLLASLVFALSWYYFAFRVLWQTVAPLISLLHAERPTMLAHVIFGACLARFPLYLPRPPAPAAPPEPEAPVEAVAPDSAGAEDLRQG